MAILKTVNSIVHAPLKEKLYELELLYEQYDVRTLCEALDVSRGTFCDHVLRNKRGNLSKELHIGISFQTRSCLPISSFIIRNGLIVH